MDVGSCFSGYAFRIEPLTKAKNSNIGLRQGTSYGENHIGGPWDSIHGAPYLKTPTTLLYDESDHVKEFGFGIHRDLGTNAKFFFENFKKSAREDQV